MSFFIKCLQSQIWTCRMFYNSYIWGFVPCIKNVIGSVCQSSTIFKFLEILLQNYRVKFLHRSLIRRTSNCRWLSKVTRRNLICLSKPPQARYGNKKANISDFPRNSNSTSHQTHRLHFIHEGLNRWKFNWTGLFSPRKAGYCNYLRVFVCLFVCLLAGFLINYWSIFDEIWWVGR